MKKKALCSCVLAAAMLAGACAGLAGCKKKQQTVEEKITDPAAIGADTDPGKIGSDKISGEQWTGALAQSSFSNVTCRIVDTKEEEDSSYTTKETISVEDGKISSTKTEAEGGENESSTTVLLTKEGETYYAYESGYGGMYVKSTETERDYMSYHVYGAVKTYAEHMKYSDLTFDESKGGYVVPVTSSFKGKDTGGDKGEQASLYAAEDDEEDEEPEYTVSGTAVAKVLKGKLVCIVYAVTHYEDGAEVGKESETLLFYNYDKTSVTLPGVTAPTFKDYESTESEVAHTVEEWNEAVKAENYDKVTCLKMQVETEEDASAIIEWNWSEFDGNKVLHAGSDKTKYYEKVAKEEGEGYRYYSYTVADGVFAYPNEGDASFWKWNWECINPVETHLEKYRNINEALFEQLSEEAYDEAKHAYVVEGVEVKVVNGKVAYIYDSEKGSLYYFYNHGTASVNCPEKVVSEELSDEAWTQAMSAMTSFSMDEYTMEGERIFTVDFDGSKTFARPFFYDWANWNDGAGTVRYYHPAHGKDTPEGTYEYMDGTEFSSTYCRATYAQLNKADYVYEAGAYHGTGEAEGNILYFKEGKLFMMVSGGEIFIFKNYGSVTVTLPENAVAEQVYE